MNNRIDDLLSTEKDNSSVNSPHNLKLNGNCPYCQIGKLEDTGNAYECSCCDEVFYKQGHEPSDCICGSCGKQAAFTKESNAKYVIIHVTGCTDRNCIGYNNPEWVEEVFSNTSEKNSEYSLLEENEALKKELSELQLLEENEKLKKEIQRLKSVKKSSGR